MDLELRQAGPAETATDPDTGTTTLAYDHRDRPLTSTNACGITVWSGYDELSRPTQQRLGGSSGTLLAEYTYDTVSVGPTVKGVESCDEIRLRPVP